MILLSEPSIPTTQPDLQATALQRFSEITQGEDYDPDIHGVLAVVEPGDTVEKLEEGIGCAILRDPWDGSRFGETGFAPCFEVLEEHPGFYELVIVPGPGDFGVVVFIPKQAGVDAELLRFCQTYATTAS